MSSNRWGLVSLALGIFVVSAQADQAPRVPTVPKDSEIRQILEARIDRYRQSVGLVAGVIEPEGRRVVAYGSLDRSGRQPVDGNTFFEVGSVTKVFTALVLADMVQRQEVALDDPAARYLPVGVTLPERGGRQISLLDLATHTSGLPPDPPDLEPRDPANPLADYSVARLDQFVSTYHLTRDIGSRYEYSNVGAAVLAQALGHRAGMDYETLLESRVLKPLGMSSTHIALDQTAKARVAVGHTFMLEPVPPGDMPAFAGSGALQSTANDLLTLLGVALGDDTSPLAHAMAAMLRVRRPTGNPTVEAAIGWDVLTLSPGYELVFKDGATVGYRSFIAYDARARTGVVVLSNAASTAGVSDIALHLLNPDISLANAKSLAPPPVRQTVAIDPAIYTGYVGRYRFANQDILTVTSDDGRLFEQLSHELRVEVYPQSLKEFFCKLFDEQVFFRTDARGVATTVVYTQHGKPRTAQRLK